MNNMTENKSISECKYSFRVTADQRVYEDFRRGGPVKIKYAKKCKRCKRHRRNLKVTSKYDISKQPLTAQMGEDSELHFMTVPRTSNRDWDPHLTLTSPIEWENSPLVMNDNLPEIKELSKGKKSPIEDNKKYDVMKNTETVNTSFPDIDFKGTKTACKETTINDPTKSRNNSSRKPHSESKRNTHRSQKPSMKLNCSNKDDTGVTQPFIAVDLRQNKLMDAENHNTIIPYQTIGIKDSAKCRYCLTNENGNTSEPLISPCQCCGTSKYVHKSCLEKWITLRDLDACEVCKTQYRTKWVHKNLCSIRFPSMKKHDVILLLITLALYITLVLQLLGIVYISVMASALPTMVTTVTLVGLALGLFWFMPSAIALTIILYTSDYWRLWRRTNKMKVIISTRENANGVKGNERAYIHDDLSLAIAV